MQNGLKWYCAISAATLDHEEYLWRDMIRVAVWTALRHTGLRPHLIYDGPNDAFCAEMRRLGTTVLHRRTTLYPELQARYQATPWLAAAICGAFLRLEIPAIEWEAQTVLYTDCDVMFLKNPVFDSQLPDIFAATSQFSKNPAEDMNSGVMLMNVPAFRARLPALFDFARRSLDLGLDQEILRAFFGTQYQVMDSVLNWKPYWGWNDAARIVHFHGPKPVAARRFLADGKNPDDANWTTLLGWNTAAYQAYTRLWYLYLEQYVKHEAGQGADGTATAAAGE